MIAQAERSPGRTRELEGLTVIVPTCNRSDLLERLLESLESQWTHLEEVIVVVNATSDDTLARVRGHAERWPRTRVLERGAPGKSGALNEAILSSEGELLTFLDDDVVVRPGWAEAYLRAFREREGQAFQGLIELPEEVRSDPDLKQRVACLRTHVSIDSGFATGERRSLTGANMAVRRSTLLEIGLFDERLGPGASGLCEDTDLAWRILHAGGRIEYVPEASVEHCFHPGRMTDSYFVDYFRRLGRSRWVMKGCPSTLRVLPDYLFALFREAWSLLHADPDRRWLYRARRINYWAMLQVSRAAQHPAPAGPQAERPS